MTPIERATYLSCEKLWKIVEKNLTDQSKLNIVEGFKSLTVSKSALNYVKQFMMSQRKHIT